MAVKQQTLEEFKASVDQITIDVMDAIYRHRPPMGVVVDSLLQVLIGALLQIPEGKSREQMRSIMLQSIKEGDDDSTEAVDMSERLKSAVN